MYVPAHEDSPSAIGLEFSAITLLDKNIKTKEKTFFIFHTLHKKMLTDPLF